MLSLSDNGGLCSPNVAALRTEYSGFTTSYFLPVAKSLSRAVDFVLGERVGLVDILRSPCFSTEKARGAWAAAVGQFDMRWTLGNTAHRCRSV